MHPRRRYQRFARRNLKSVYYGDVILEADNLYGEYYGFGLYKKDDVKRENPIFMIYCEEATGEWKLKKADLYVPLTVQYDVVTLIGTKTITIAFSSNISVQINEAWSNKVLYAGTTVLLSATNNKNALFSAGDGISFVAEGVNASYLDLGAIQPQTNYTIEAKYDGKTIRKFSGFVIKPNVIATLNSGAYTSGDEKGLSELYTLQQYKTEENSVKFIYGSSENNLYKADNLTELSDKSKLSISFGSNDNKNPKLEEKREIKNASTN